MAWICCAGSGSCGLSACRGTTRSVVMPGISAGGCRWRGNRSGCIGESRIAMVPGSLRRLRGWLTRRRCGRIARRCCAAFMTFTWRPAPGRWSIRSRWTGHAGAGEPMPIATRWSRSAASAAACTGRRCRRGYRAASRMRSSTRSTSPWVISLSCWTPRPASAGPPGPIAPPATGRCARPGYPALPRRSGCASCGLLASARRRS